MELKLVTHMPIFGWHEMAINVGHWHSQRELWKQ